MKLLIIITTIIISLLHQTNQLKCKKFAVEGLDYDEVTP